MERLKNITIIFLLAIGLLVPAALAKLPSVLLREGLYAEETEGDIDAAIKIYEQIVEDSSAQRPYVAKAMYRLGLCYLKKQNEQKAKIVFEQLTTQFPDQTAVVDKVEYLLDKMGGPDPAVLMPPDTKLYIEFGHPGRQVETILKMLKGTPFENPLAVIGGGSSKSRKSPGKKSPGDILAALLNPSMMAEFKKIRGMAIGITEIKSNNPPSIAVLYPGKSDALRGIILAALGMVGTAGEPIEGMQTMTIVGTAGAAYDDNVIIIAQPREQLTWCVKQYKGITSEPTLASENKVFAKISKENRRANAMTVWIDVAGTYSAVSDMMSQMGQTEKLRVADGLADLKNIEDIIASLLIEETGIAMDANINFKDDHNCLIYNMIRTPNLSRSGFEGVPSEAVVVASLALGQSGSSSVETAQKAVEKLTGLSIGREIFANIEQVNIFAVPPRATANEGDKTEHIVSCFGLAVTSHNPQHTYQLLTQILETADLLTTPPGREQSAQQSSPAAGKYLLPLGGDRKICCYVGQRNKTTVLAFSPEVVAASLSAVRSGRSALTAGPLQGPLRRMPSDTSKTALINVGGAIRVADAFITLAHDNPLNPAHKTLAQLAQACDKTSVQLRTGESVDNFNVRISIEQLPPLDSVLPLLMQLSQANLTAKARATKPRPADGAVFGLTPELQLKWKPGVNAKSHKVYFGTEADELSSLADVKTPSDVELPPLKEGATYYWRVDEIWADGSVVTGDIWSFTIGELVGWWKFDEGSGTTAYDSSGKGNHGQLIGDTQWVADGLIGGALYFNDFSDTACRVEIPTEGMSASAGTIALRDSHNRKMGMAPLDAETWYHIALTWNGDTYVVYLDGQKLSTGAYTGLSTLNTYANIGNDGGELNEAFDGTIDDVRIYNYALSPDEIETIYRVKAVKPRPVDKAVVGSATKVELSWTPGIDAASHKVLFGTEPDELALLAEATSPTYAGLPALEKDTTYYWRVDEVQANGTVVSGGIWSFTTSGRLLGWWELDEASGGIAQDSSGNEHSGTLHGDPSWQPAGGKVGGALKFDGDGDYVEISDEPDFDLTGQITVAAWIKARAFDKGRQAIVTKGGSAWRLHRNLKTDNIRFNITYGYVPSAVGKVNVNDGQWHHVAGAYDGAKVYLYVDGVLDNSAKASGSIETNDQPVCIGENAEQTGRYWNGLIDDVRIYNYALSHDEIVALYQGK